MICVVGTKITITLTSACQHNHWLFGGTSHRRCIYRPPNWNFVHHHLDRHDRNYQNRTLERNYFEYHLKIFAGARVLGRRSWVCRCWYLMVSPSFRAQQRLWNSGALQDLGLLTDHSLAFVHYTTELSLTSAETYEQATSPILLAWTHGPLFYKMAGFIHCRN